MICMPNVLTQMPQTRAFTMQTTVTLAADGNGRNARRSFKLADDNKVCHPVKGLQEIGNDKGNGKRNKALPNTPRKGIDSHKTRS